MISFVGPTHQKGQVYSIINNNLIRELRSYDTVLNNFHNLNGEWAELLIAHEYPPSKPTLFHDRNICLTAWEFTGEKSFPESKIKAVNYYHKLLVPSEWTARNLRPQLDIPVDSIFWGLDESYYHQENYEPFISEELRNKTVLLWIGGTDKRHGFDIALRIMKYLPKEFVLLAKQSAYYPAIETDLDNVIIIREDLDSLIPLYKCADIFLNTARGVGFSLPTLEAIACGLPVVSTPLPPIQEFKHCDIYFSQLGQWESMKHHLYSDCIPYWFEPDVDDLINTILKVENKPNLEYNNFMEYYTWSNAVKNIMEKINCKF